jgi:hypothetical protein
MKIGCQIAIVGILLMTLLTGLYSDCEGRLGSKPGGFRGVLVTLLVVSVMGAIYYGAGAFSELLPK